MTNDTTTVPTGADAALALLVAAVEAETDPGWDCNSYHPSLWPALKAARAALASAAQAPQAVGMRVSDTGRVSVDPVALANSPEFLVQVAAVKRLREAQAAPAAVAGPSVWGFRFPTGGRWHYTEHGPNDRSREELIWRPFYEAPQPAIQQGDDAAALNEIADIFQIGSKARKDRWCILENVRNSFRRSQCLSRIEHSYFMVPRPPDDWDEDDEGGEECLLNWGDEPDEYAKRFGEALAQMAAPAPAAQGDALPREDFAWMVVQEACETEPADEDDPECIRILRRDLKSAVLAAFLREAAARAAKEGAKHDR